MRRRMSLGIGYGKSPDSRGYDGHVVALIEGRYIMDLTLDQASGRRRRSAYGTPRLPSHERGRPK
jgi:hypothetical protein